MLDGLNGGVPAAHGYVRDDGGNAVEGAHVEYWCFTHGRPVGAYDTGADGYYEIYDVRDNPDHANCCVIFTAWKDGYVGQGLQILHPGPPPIIIDFILRPEIQSP